MLAGFLIFLLVLIVLLAIPLSLDFRIARKNAFSGSLKLVWFFGLVRIDLPVSQPAKSISRRSGQDEKEAPVKKNRSRPVLAIRHKAFRRRMIQFIVKTWKAIHKENLVFRLRLGLGDPADTGELWAFVGPLAGVLASIRKASIDIQPEFMDACFELEGSGRIRVLPLQLIILVMGLAFSPAFWQGIGRLRTVA